ncbi:phage tail assembly chaperone G [Listeria fleischmannii]|uniref:Phage protein n=1 Tax=Listeria fleischmannii FSL S10-1203 TaxID=1265822 RepID=W7E032_9LIST|nr:hypothetical protein MCOL2_05630 [Listeria fleischmannii FSL S10-1203]
MTQKRKKKNTYTQTYVSARHVRNGLELQAEMTKENSSDLESLDQALAFIVALFDDKKVTADRILDGLAYDELWETIGNILRAVIRGESADGDTSGK